jgi:hypothetical protein
MISLRRWASIFGLVLVALGIIIGFYLPTVAARWGGPETLTLENWIQFEARVGLVFVLAGTALQIYGAWPRKPTD